MPNLGDKVICDIHNGKNEYTRGLLTYLGIVIGDNNNGFYNIMYFDEHKISIAYSIDHRYIIPIEDNKCERVRIMNRYENLIEEEKKKLKTVSQEEKDKEKVERYENIKQRIIRNCEWCINKDLDDEDFINRVKEIANLKKQLFAPEKLSCISKIHKYNGAIKYNIRELFKERDKMLQRISDEEIQMRLSKL